jgi:hypothetical protein
MKKITLALTLLTSMSFVFGQNSESVFLQAGYANQSYYHLDNGEVSNVDNNNWDLAFDASGYGSAIRINGMTGTKLFVYPNGDASNWASIDTIGISTWNEITNSDLSWGAGAFNSTIVANDPFDLGWGVYSMITHHINGDSVHVIQLSNGDYKKLHMTKLSSGNYDFKYANLDGSNEVVTTVSKSNYAGKNFGYYSIQNNSALDREPTADSWHLVFTKYITQLYPGMNYGVTGVLTNNGLEVAKAENVDVTNVDHNNFSFVPEINAIGYNWKSFNMGTFSYVIQDSLCYFIKDASNTIWKLELTGFDGSSTGGIHFNVENLSTSTDITAYDNDLLFKVYPNPSQGRQVSILYDIDNLDVNNSVDIYDMNGRIVKSFRLNSNGFNDKRVSLDNFEAGVYLISFINGNELIKKKLILQ